MSAISELLEDILSAVYGEEVRQAIHDAISQCYSDVSNPTLQTEALEAAIQAKIDAGEMAALTIGDGTITTAKIADGAITSGKMASGVIPTVDSTLSVQGAAADAKAVGDALVAGGEGLSSREKTLLLTLFSNIAYSGNISDIYEELEESWSAEPIPVGTKMIASYSDNPTKTWSLSYLPYHIHGANITYDYTKEIVYLEGDVSTSGTLVIGKSNKSDIVTNANVVTPTVLETIQLNSIGFQKIILQNPITLNDGECLSICSGTSAIFNYGSAPDNGYYYGASKYSYASSYGLGLDVYAR